MADRYIPEHRRTQFKAKNQFKPDELRRRREEQQVEIRKQKREENLAKRRGIQTSDGGIIGGQVGVDSDEEEGGTIEGEVSCILFSSDLPLNYRPMRHETRISRFAGRCLFVFFLWIFSYTSCLFSTKLSTGRNVC